MKIYVTKYALTSGIQVFDAVIKGEMAVVREPGQLPQHFYGNGKDWHLTAESALEMVEEMRIKKLKSLDRQMKKIGAMKFKAP